MTEREDNRLLDYLYGEMADGEAQAFETSMTSDDALGAEANDLRALLNTVRQVEDEEPAPHLDALILAHARQEAEALKEQPSAWFKKLFSGPVIGIFAAGTCAVVLAVVVMPTMSGQNDIAEPAAMAPAPSAPVAKLEAKRARPQPTQQPAKPALRANQVPADESFAYGPGAGAKSVAGDYRPASTAKPKPMPKGATRARRKRPPAKKRKMRPPPMPAEKPRFEPMADAKKPTSKNQPLGGRTGAGGGSARAQADPPPRPTTPVVATPPPPPPSAPARRAKAAASRSPEVSLDSAPETVTETAARDEEADMDDLSVARNTRADEGKKAGKLAERESNEVATKDDDAMNSDRAALQAATRVHKEAIALIKKGQPELARRLYSRARVKLRRTVAYDRITLWLAHLEYSQGNYLLARRYADEAQRSRDPAIRRQAKKVVAEAAAATVPDRARAAPAAEPARD